MMPHNPEYDLTILSALGQAKRAAADLHTTTINIVTERWLKKLLGQGPGWKLWRSHPQPQEEDPFIIRYGFALVPPGEDAPGAGILFTQPELSPGERERLIAGRHDWRDHEWQDHCGVADCGHKCCEDYRR